MASVMKNFGIAKIKKNHYLFWGILRGVFIIAIFCHYFFSLGKFCLGTDIFLLSTTYQLQANVDQISSSLQ
jgi:hypothetical protein